MKTSRKVRNFSREIIQMAEKKGFTEEEFTSAIDTARKSSEETLSLLSVWKG